MAQLKQQLIRIIDKNNANTAFPEEALPVLEDVCSAVEANGLPEVSAVLPCSSGAEQLRWLDCLRASGLWNQTGLIPPYVHHP